MAKRKVEVEVTPQSFKKFQDLFKKFNIKWDEKVFKSTDKLNDHLRKLNKSIVEWNTAIERQRNQQMRKEIDDIRKGKGGGAGGFQGTFTTDMFTNLNDVLTKVVASMEKMKQGVGDTTDAHWEEKKALSEGKTESEAHNAELRRDLTLLRQQGYGKRDAYQRETQMKKQEMMMQRAVMDGTAAMFGTWQGVFKAVMPQVEELFQPMMNQGKFNSYMESGEGQNDILEYEKMNSPLGKMGKQNEMQQKGDFTGGIAENQKKGGGIMGKAMGKIGNIMNMGKAGGVGGIAKGLGGAKGMMMLGGAMAGIKIIQKGVQLAIASSPMMQQMLKLWKFGIMMIFRPIGDFFGFFLRPIFVYLLRKFIIPFYQTYLPLMQELGQTLGESVVGVLESIFGILHILNPLYTEQKDLLKGVTGSVDAINPQLLSDTELITAAIENSKLNTDDLMGDWQRFAEQLFPNQDVKGYDIAGMGDNIPLTQAAVDFYRELGHQVIPSLKDGSGRFDSGVSTFSTATQQFADTVASIQAGEAGNTERVGGEDPRSQKKTIIVIDNSGNSTTTGDGITPEDQDDVDAALEATQYKRGAWS